MGLLEVWGHAGQVHFSKDDSMGGTVLVHDLHHVAHSISEVEHVLTSERATLTVFTIFDLSNK